MKYWVKILYAGADHPYPDGRIIYVEAQNKEDETVIKQHNPGLPVSLPDASFIQPDKCFMSEEQELSVQEIEDLLIKGEQTIDLETGVLCNVPDTERKDQYDREQKELE